MVVAAGGFDVVALDLGDGAPRAPSASWIRLKHGAERQGTTILVATPARAVGAFAAAAVELTAGAPAFLVAPPLFDGIKVRAAAMRGRDARAESAPGGAPCALLAFTFRS